MSIEEGAVFSFPRQWQGRWEETFPWMGTEIIGGLVWWNVVAFLLVAVLAAAVHLALVWVIRRKLTRDAVVTREEPEHQTDARRWYDMLLDAGLNPLAALVWIYGLYLAFSLLFLTLRELEPQPMVLAFLDWIRDFGFFVILIWFLFRVIDEVDARLSQRAKQTGNKWDRILSPLVGRTLRLVLPLVAIIAGLPLFPITAEAVGLARTGLSVLVILFVVAILFQTVRALEEGLLANFPVDVADNLAARKIHTQVTVLKKVALVTIGVLALAAILMVFEPLRRFGTSILASAGIAGIILGLAAQRSLGTLLAGFQIAITQPIRLDDVVIVEGEWGRIEEITLTYVVVRIWDLRRLVLPIDYFITQPFQNWTRTSANILGSVFLHVDYTVPVPALREHLDRVLENDSGWDKKVKVLQVTDSLERTLQLRILVSAADAGTAWDLRCRVREAMVEFIRERFPEALPRFRAELAAPPTAGAAGFLPGGGEK